MPASRKPPKEKPPIEKHWKMVLGVLSGLGLTYGAGSALTKKLPSAGSISVLSLEQFNLATFFEKAGKFAVILIVVYVAICLFDKGRPLKKTARWISQTVGGILARCRTLVVAVCKRILQFVTDYASWQKFQDLKFKFRKEERAHFGRIRVRHGLRLNPGSIELNDAFTEVGASIYSPNDPRSLSAGTANTGTTIWDHIKQTRLHPGVGILVSGPLGSGKTTLLRHVMLKYVPQMTHKRGLRLRLLGHPLPVYIELKHLRLPENADHHSLPNVLAQAAIKTLSTTIFSETELTEMLQRELSCSACILLLDGLDEIANHQERERISIWLARQFNHPYWRGNLFILSAIDGAVDISWLGDIKLLHIQPLSASSVRDLILKWQLNQQRELQPQAPTPVLQQRASKATDDFFANIWNKIAVDCLPLTPDRLMQACTLHDTLPTEESFDHQFFKETQVTALTRWVLKKHPDKKVQDMWTTREITIHRRIIGAVAHHLHSQPPPPGAAEGHLPSLDTVQLLAIAGPYLKDLKVGRNLHESYLRDLAWQTDLIKYSTHSERWYLPGRTFQEFICADHWVHAPSSLPPDWRPLVADPIWQGPLRHFLKLAKAPSELVEIVQLHGGDLGAKLLADHNNQNVLALQQPPGPDPLPASAAPAATPTSSAPSAPPSNLTHPM